PPRTMSQEEDEEEAREQVHERREEAVFERSVGPVKKLEDKYYKPPPGSRVRDRPYSSEPAKDLITPGLPRSGPGLNEVPSLDGAQRAMLKRLDKVRIQNAIRELNIRGDGVEDALRQLELFVHKAWKDEERFVRIIHGRGLRSENEPVLKPAVLTWLEGPGLRYIRGYVPEIQSGGDYGSLIVELVMRSKESDGESKK
ncbi:MAG: Smr/MutS family protein, partial [Bradymonadaceae bacterium]